MKPKYLCQAAILMTLVGTGSGCAIIMHGTTQTVPVASSPSGARVFVDGRYAGVTPCNVELKRDRPHQFVFKKVGYEDASASTSIQISGWIYFDGLIELAIDINSGAAYNITPASVSVNLVRRTGAADIHNPTAVDRRNPRSNAFPRPNR